MSSNFRLTKNQLEVITQVVCEHIEREGQKQKKAKQDHRLYNIKLLLTNYRGLVLHCEKIKDELIEIDSTSIQDLDISTISIESIESIKRSREKSLAMVMFINSKIEAYKRSSNEGEMRYFRVLEKKYLTSKKYTINEIAESENIDKTTVYRYLEKAITDLSVIFFGIDAINFM